MLAFTMLHPRMTQARLGFLPLFFSLDDERPAREQLDERYAHGGGFSHINGFNWNKEKLTISYPGDPNLTALATAKLNSETLYFFDHALLLIEAADGSWQITRVD